MIALYTDVKAGSCLLCRNLLESEETQGTAVRVYAVEELDIGPPSPPGSLKDDVAHFSIISEPSPPPPPHPPPRPPRTPPPPLPAALGTKADTHIECEFSEGTDFSLKKGVHGDYTDLTADTAKHCCSLCGMHPPCTDFVFEPASRTCALLPHVLEHQLVKNPNPSTIAGSVTITRLNVHHAACHFEVGSGYAGGGLGLGKPLPGQTKMSSKQDCCDACDREPECAKFTYEKYGGVCHLHSSIAEHYYTFNMMSGTLDERADPPEAKSSGAHDDAPADDIGINDLDIGLDGVVHSLPPTPPLFIYDSAPPPLPPPGDAESSQDVLAYFSLAAIGMMGIAMAMCTYLFFATEINNVLYSISFGKLGRRPKSLLPIRKPAGGGDALPTKKMKLGLLQPGWAKVTVQTTQVTQKKEMEIAGCSSHEALRALIAEEFGHVLRGTNLKEFTLLAWVKEEDEGATWMVVTAASDIEMVCLCTAIKLTPNDLIEADELEVAYHSGQAGGAKAKSKRRDVAVNGETAPSDSRRKMKPPKKKGGFQRVSTASPSPEEDEDSDADAPLCADLLNGHKQNGKHSKKQNGSRKNGSRQISSAGRQNGQQNGSSRALVLDPSDSDSDDELEDILRTGTRVQLHGLTGKAELNGRKGTVLGHDLEKGRYRVRVETGGAGAPTPVMAFKPENVRVA